MAYNYWTSNSVCRALACLAIIMATFLVCRRIISYRRHINDEFGHRRPILVSSSQNVSYTRGFYTPVKSTPILPSYNDQRRHSRSSSVKISDTRDFHVLTKSTVKTLKIPEHCRNVSNASCVPPPRKEPSTIKVLPKVLLSKEGANVIVEEDLGEKALRMKRGGQKARKPAKQARKRRNFNAKVKHKRNTRVRKCAMEGLDKKPATAIFNKKNKVSWPIASRFQRHAH